MQIHVTGKFIGFIVLLSKCDWAKFIGCEWSDYTFIDALRSASLLF